jgi:hypothetical protein
MIRIRMRKDRDEDQGKAEVTAGQASAGLASSI